MKNQTYIEIEKIKKKIEESLARYGEYSTELIELYEEIADLYCSLNEFETCQKYLLEVLKIKRHFYGDKNLALIKTYNQLATVSDDANEIIFYFQEVIRIKNLIYGATHVETANTYTELANVYAYIQEYEKAIEFYQYAVEIYIKYEDTLRDLIGCYNEMSNILWEQNKRLDALVYGKKALEKVIDLFGELHHDTASYYCSVGVMCYELAMYEESLSYYEKSLEIFKKLYNENDENILFVEEEIKNALLKLKK